MQKQLRNGATICFDESKGQINDIYYRGQHLIKNGVPIFCVKIRNKDGENEKIFSTDCKFIKENNNVFYYENTKIDCELAFIIRDDSIVWKLNVLNKTEKMIEWVELMSFGVDNKLKDEDGGKGYIIVPYNEGCLVSNMAYRESMPFKYIEPDYPSKNCYSIFPNMIFSQFIAYLCDGVGIYLGMEDVERTPKHIDYCYYKDTIKVFMRTFCNCNYGESYYMPFESSMCIFDGEWQDACEIYRNWFYKNLPQGLVRICDNNNLPKWYDESPLVVAYPIRGTKDSNMIDNGSFPYQNTLPLLEQIAKATDSKIMALLMHWEGTAQWAPPYMWPPLGGEEMFADFVKQLHSREMLIGLYASGFGYTIQSNIDKDYNLKERFEKDKIEEIVCTNSNGTKESTICLAQRKGYDLCPAMDKTKKIIREEIEKVAESGVDYMQALDQNHGGGPYFCYSDKHNHIPAPGKWQIEETQKLLNSIKKGNMLLGCESASSEPFLSKLQFSDNRYQLNFYNGKPIPMYSYIYHEFVNNFMGNQICSMIEKKDNNFTYRLAYSFICGDVLTITMVGDKLKYSWCDWIEPKDKTVDKNIAFGFIKTLNDWRKGNCKDFLHFGKMIKGIEYSTSNQKFLTEDGKTYLIVKSILSSAFEIKGKKIQFFVNYNLEPIHIVFSKNIDVYCDCALAECKNNIKEMDINPLQVVVAYI